MTMRCRVWLVVLLGASISVVVNSACAGFLSGNLPDLFSADALQLLDLEFQENAKDHMVFIGKWSPKWFSSTVLGWLRHAFDVSLLTDFLEKSGWIDQVYQRWI